CLNRTVDAVWRRCDGRRTVAAIARSLRPALPVPPDADVVLLAVRQLRRAGLLAGTADEEDLPAGPSRRELLVRLGGAAAVWLPLVTSVVAPMAASAASAGACQAGRPITQAECKTDNPAFTDCCCIDKGPLLCVMVSPGKWGCDGAPCVP
ncbi:MAG TPA: PqqD family protein, partial [Vicinamibacteria bacterium]|nr:PqqD family protein [Vicinamibacteria bacterium]